MAFPAEGLIRLIRGGPYPNLSMPKPAPGQTILDIGCGDGSAFPLYNRAGLIASGCEISDAIVSNVKRNLIQGLVPYKEIKTGLVHDLPWEDNTFDYAVAWNSCYYMSMTPSGKFEDHVSEMARVIKPGGWLICSVPNRDCFIFEDVTHDDNDKYVTVNSEYFGLREGERMRFFSSRLHFEHAFSSHFTDFSRGTIDIFWFGLCYSWYILTARKCSR